MPEYRCKVALQNGELVERVIVSDSTALLKKSIAKDGGFLVKAEKAGGVSFFLPFSGRPKLKPKEFYSFNQEFLTLLRAGLPVVMAFDGILEKREESFYSKILKDIRDSVSQGESIANSFKKYEDVLRPSILPPYDLERSAATCPMPLKSTLNILNV